MIDDVNNVKEINDLADFQEGWYKSAGEEEKTLFRDWLLEVLKIHNPVEIAFYKSDGTVRQMKCTLKASVVPPISDPKISDTLCTVWDIDISAWRSFKFENLKAINFTVG